MEKQKFLNTYINNITMKEAINEIEQMIIDKRKSFIVAINVDVVMKMENDILLREISDKADKQSNSRLNKK